MSMALWAQAPESQQRQEKLAEQVKALHWIDQGQGEIGSNATVKIPKGYAFLDDKDTAKLLQLYGNPPTPNHYLIAPRSLDWFAVFSFDDTGYIKDDEKINAPELLSSIKAADAEGNQ
ncbi:hypothetical protein AVHY2522_05305 [Acidovorax sp. SUPP2522]|nr:hypothetical protein AVHY2522_05305 [Acidovorax sp. SUPP2522]